LVPLGTLRNLQSPSDHNLLYQNYGIDKPSKLRLVLPDKKKAVSLLEDFAQSGRQSMDLLRVTKEYLQNHSAVKKQKPKKFIKKLLRAIGRIGDDEELPFIISNFWRETFLEIQQLRFSARQKKAFDSLKRITK